MLATRDRSCEWAVDPAIFLEFMCGNLPEEKLHIHVASLDSSGFAAPRSPIIYDSGSGEGMNRRE